MLRKIKVIKHKVSLEVENNDLKKRETSKHGILFPSTVRCIITGPSGAGKTNVMISLIEHENGLKFENIYLYSRSLSQPKYIYLEHLLKPIKGIHYFAYNAGENILDPSKARKNSIFIFDDVACDNQDIIREYFSRGRHNNIDSFYLCQTYAKIPKHLIRDNANVVVLFKQDDTNLKHVYQDHVGTDMAFDEFKQICFHCWKIPFQFLSIFTESDLNRGRYRKNFDYFICFE
nr:TPA_asm: FtsK [Bos-associated insect adintovirus 2]